MSDGVWFKITVGRERNADPKWLLPEICRQGEVSKQDIGTIRVYDTETRFEVSARAAERFAALVAARKKGGVRIFPAPDGSPPIAHASSQPLAPRRAEDEKPKHPSRPHSAAPKNKKFFAKKNKKSERS
jgi:ATP-dependent RNA helicase DeaD